MVVAKSGSAATADRRTQLLVEALRQGATPLEATKLCGLSIASIEKRLSDPEVMRRIVEARPACPVCRGQGYCSCGGCAARRAEPLRRSIWWGVEATFHNGRTCHNCFGTGKSPIRQDRSRRTTAGWERLRQEVLEAWIAENGLVCPGFGRPPHPADQSELTVDHIRAVAAGGERLSLDNLRILCRSCNSRKSHIGGPKTGEANLRPGQREAMIAMGAALRGARERAGVDIAELSSALKLSKRYVSGVEDGAIVVQAYGDNGRPFPQWLWVVRITETEAFRRQHGNAFAVPYFEQRHGNIEHQLKLILEPIPGLRRRRDRDAAKELRARAQACLDELAAAWDYPALDAVWDVVRAEVWPKHQDLLLVASTGRIYSEWLELVRLAGLLDREQIQRWLQAEHHLGRLEVFNLAIRLSRTLASEREAAAVDAPASEVSSDS